jgi:hypothetical protein
MNSYQIHPDSYYGVEIRDGQSVDDYIAKARGFSSTAEFREYRDSSPERQAEMRNRRNRDNSADSDDDRRRALEFLRIENV